MADQSLFVGVVPSSGNEADGTTNYALGMRFSSDVDGQVTSGAWYFPATTPSAITPVKIGIYRVSDQALLGQTAFSLLPTLGARNVVAFSPAIDIVADETYAVVIWTPLRYVATPSYPWPATSTNLTATSSNCWLAVNPGTLVFPTTQSGNAAWYGVDIVFAPGDTPENHITTGTAAAAVTATATRTTSRARTGIAPAATNATAAILTTRPVTGIAAVAATARATVLTHRLTAAVAALVATARAATATGRAVAGAAQVFVTARGQSAPRGGGGPRLATTARDVPVRSEAKPVAVRTTTRG